MGIMYYLATTLKMVMYEATANKESLKISDMSMYNIYVLWV